MNLKKLFGFLVVFILLSTSSYAQEEMSASPIRVVASFSIIGDMVRQIGGEHVDVTVLVGAGRETHHFQPNPQDAVLFTHAEIIAINGLGFEGWIGRLIEASGTSAQLLVASKGIVPLMLDAGHEHDGHKKQEEPSYDPHAWQDLKNGEIYARNIALALMEARPEYAEPIAARARAYIIQMRTLDQKLRNDFAGLSEEKRTVITSHGAFGYFAHAYGLTFLAPVGAGMNAQASAADMAKLITRINEEKIRALFLENAASPRLIKQIAKDTKARVGGVLYADSLSPPRGPAPTYLEMMAHNAKVILKKLR